MRGQSPKQQLQKRLSQQYFSNNTIVEFKEQFNEVVPRGARLFGQLIWCLFHKP